MKETKTVCVHVNDRYVSSDVGDLDVYDFYTLECAVRSCASQALALVKLGLAAEAVHYITFKDRIKEHLRTAWA